MCWFYIWWDSFQCEWRIEGWRGEECGDEMMKSRFRRRKPVVFASISCSSSFLWLSSSCLQSRLEFALFSSRLLFSPPLCSSAGLRSPRERQFAFASSSARSSVSQLTCFHSSAEVCSSPFCTSAAPLPPSAALPPPQHPSSRLSHVHYWHDDNHKKKIFFFHRWGEKQQFSILMSEATQTSSLFLTSFPAFFLFF